MLERSKPTFTALLAQVRDGDRSAIGGLFPIVYEQLKQIARGQRRRQQEGTLNTTALVHEAFIKLTGRDDFGPRDRNHFLAVSAIAMRQILVDHARSRLAAKRGGGNTPISLEAIEPVLESGPRFSYADS